MSKRGSHTEFTFEDFLRVLSDGAVQEKLCEILANSIKLIIGEILAPIERKLKSDIGEVNASIQSLQLKIDERSEQMKALQTANVDLSDKLWKERAARDELEQYSRRENLLFTGIPATIAERTAAAQTEQTHLTAETSETTTNKVISFCKDVLHVNIESSDISIAHRCKQRRGSNVPPVLVRFIRRSKRDEVFRAKFHLKAYNANRSPDDRAYVNEDLTESNRKLLGTARKAVSDSKLDSAWSSNCRIFVKTLAPDGRRLAVTTIQRLNELVESV